VQKILIFFYKEHDSTTIFFETSCKFFSHVREQCIRAIFLWRLCRCVPCSIGDGLISAYICDLLCQEGNCITHVCICGARDATNFKGCHCCGRSHRKKKKNADFRNVSAQALFSSNNKNAVNYDRLLSRRFFGEELFSCCVFRRYIRDFHSFLIYDRQVARYF